VGAVGFAVLESTRPDRVAVVNAAGTLRSEPVLGAEAGRPSSPRTWPASAAAPACGPAWSSTATAPGWIESDRLVPLAE
jgi:hypothetical protein